ncbi:MAG: nicotinate (nicotinamide) nucleotide adenylyltransferase [bacterium]|nr:nicotinate (nicotinamide) nucleotide adenylyltransferase [bacterium]
MAKTRIGLLGGTFNPVHHGHIDLGRHIKDAFQLDKVLYILSARPPHKKELEKAPIEIRWNMLEMALQHQPGLEPCDIEIKRDAWSWTIDTVTELKKRNPQSDFYFISGSEGFLKIKTWKNYKQLLDAVSFIVVLRKAHHREEVKNLLGDGSIDLFGADVDFSPGGLDGPRENENRGHVSAGSFTTDTPSPGAEAQCGNSEAGMDFADATAPQQTKTAVHLFAYESEKLFISSTLIREKCRTNQPVDGLVDDRVKPILEEYKLYGSR